MILNDCYKLADNLQMDILKQGNSITGDKMASIPFGDLMLKGHVKIVASWTSKEGDGLVMVETFGDVGLMIGVEDRSIQCAVVDLAKLPKRGEGFFTKNKCKTFKTAETLAMSATVARFSRKGAFPWQPVVL